jgi:vacuolar protein sorting-associated protein 35
MDPEQEKFLEDAKRVIKEQAFFMKKSLDAGKLRDALRSSSTMLNELKTSQLSPRTYYILFM